MEAETFEQFIYWLFFGQLEPRGESEAPRTTDSASLQKLQLLAVRLWAFADEHEMRRLQDEAMRYLYDAVEVAFPAMEIIKEACEQSAPKSVMRKIMGWEDRLAATPDTFTRQDTPVALRCNVCESMIVDAVGLGCCGHAICEVCVSTAGGSLLFGLSPSFNVGGGFLGVAPIGAGPSCNQSHNTSGPFGGPSSAANVGGGLLGNNYGDGSIIGGGTQMNHPGLFGNNTHASGGSLFGYATGGSGAFGSHGSSSSGLFGRSQAKCCPDCGSIATKAPTADQTMRLRVHALERVIEKDFKGVCNGVAGQVRPGYGTDDLESLDGIAGFVADFAEELAGAGGSMTMREGKAVDAYLVV